MEVKGDYGGHYEKNSMATRKSQEVKKTPKKTTTTKNKFALTFITTYIFSYSANLDDLGVTEAIVAGYVTLLKK